MGANILDMSKKIQTSSQKCSKTTKKSQNIRVSKQNNSKNNKNTTKSHSIAQTIQYKSKIKSKSKPLNQNLAINQSELTRLTRQWYKVLADAGFEDIESHDAKMRPRPLIGGMSLRSIANRKHWQKTYHFYARLRTFLTFNPDWTKNKSHKLIAELYTEGHSYRKIIQMMKDRRFKIGMNVFNVHKVVHAFIKEATTWNLASSNGLDYEPDVG